VKLTFTVEVDEEGLQDYYRQYPDLAESDGRQAGRTLIREAIAQWNWDGLLKSDDIYEAAEVSNA
jgi:hypothetical protein